jgi:hypothetical protein
MNMTMQKFKSLALGALVCGLTLGVLPTANAAEPDVTHQPFTLSADVGTLGVGASLGWRFADHFGVRGGVNYLGYSRDGNDIEGVKYNSKLRLLSEPVGLDLFPWKNRSFRVTVGVLINQNELQGTAPDPGVPGTTIITLGDLGRTYDVNTDLRGLNLKVEQDSLAPYLSIGGNFYFDRAKHWSLSGEIGVAYTGSPKASINIGNPTTALNPIFIADRAAEERQIEDKISDYKFYPIVKLGLNFSF